jgi:hypothetical protein
MQQVTSKKERYALFDVMLGSGPTKWWRNLKSSRRRRLSKVRRAVGKQEIKAQLN